MTNSTKPITESILSDVSIQDEKNRKDNNMQLADRYFIDNTENAIYAEFSDRNPVLTFKNGEYCY